MSELDRIHTWNEVAGNKREPNEQLLKLYIDLIHEELQELHEAESDVEELDALGDLLVVVTGAIHAKGRRAEDVLKRINDSNFSKFDTTEEDAKYSVLSYGGDSRYENVRYEKVGDYFVIRGDKVGGAKNKILKSHKYKEPELGDL